MTTHLPGVPDETVIGVIPAGQLAELGIAVDVPILAVNWLDERIGCERAHRYLGGELQGIPSDWQGCYFYQVGRCTMNGSEEGRPRSACLFHEAESGKSWDKVRGWRLLEYPDGRQTLCLARDAAGFAAELGARVVDHGEGVKVTQCAQ